VSQMLRLMPITLLVAGCFCIQLGFAFFAWRRLNGKLSTEIDIAESEYDDAAKFREDVMRWASTGVRDGGGLVRVMTTASFPNRFVCGHTLVVHGDFVCEQNCRFFTDVYVKGNACIGSGSRFRSIAVDGDLTIGDNVRIDGWADAFGAIRVGHDCIVTGRLTSLRSLQLGDRIRLKAACAPKVWTSLSIGERILYEKPIPPSVVVQRLDLESEITSGNAVRLAQDYWMVRGDFRPSTTVKLSSKLVIKGACELKKGSSLFQDLKCGEALILGEQCRAHGSVVSGHDILIGEGSECHGIVHADGSIHLARRVRVRGAGRAFVYAGRRIFLGEGVLVEGKMIAREFIQTGSVGVAARGGTLSGRAKLLLQGVERTVRPTAAALMLLLASGLLGAQEADHTESVRPPLLPTRMELGVRRGGFTPAGGSWVGTEIQLTLNQIYRVTPIVSGESIRTEAGTQENVSVVSYANWSKNFYTVQGISRATGVPGISLFPHGRYDVKAFWKTPFNRNFVAGVGFTNIDYGQHANAQLYNIGAILYKYRWVFEANIFLNRSNPGGLWSNSGVFSAQRGRERDYWWGVTAGGGRELYRTERIPAGDVDMPGYSFGVFYRKWLSRHTGLVLSFDHQDRIGVLRRLEWRTRFFVDL